jgi:energy-coupling factor transporter ATP-binding protein EcfA2
LKLRGVPRGERAGRVDELLAMVHLDDFAAKRPPELSGGMRQRVALARALAQDPDVLLMDEPFGALDAMTRDRLHDELEQLWHRTGKTVMFVTHKVREAVRLGDRVLLMASRPGRVAATFPVTIPRPRRIDSPEVAALAATTTDRLRAEVSGGDHSRYDVDLDALLADGRRAPRRAAKAWAVVWPKLVAVNLVVGIWQIIVWTGWKSEVVLRSPFTVFDGVIHNIGDLTQAAAVTLRRAVLGFAVAILIGGIIGVSVARVRVLRAGVGSMITGLQMMPSVAWFPLAIVLFSLSPNAILFVIILGAAPSIATASSTGSTTFPPCSCARVGCSARRASRTCATSCSRRRCRR